MTEITTEYVKNFLSDLVLTVVPYAHTQIFVRNKTYILREPPVVGIMIGTVTDAPEQPYGRKTPDDGDYEMYPFTLTVLASNCKEEGCSESKYANDIADKITKYMKKNRQAFKYKEIHDILNISSHEMTEKESTSYSMSTNTITGKLQVRNTD